jgi:hypothetical protein
MKRLLTYLLPLYLVSANYQVSAQNSISLTKKDKQEVLTSIIDQTIRSYIFPDTAKQIVSFLKQQYESGAYDTITYPKAFSRKITQDIRSVYHDQHFSVMYAPKMAPEYSKNAGQSQNEDDQLEKGRSINFGFVKAEILKDNIGYVRIDNFWWASPESMKTAKAALQFIANCKALIFDLRYNLGGEPEMINYLCGFLFKDKTHLNDLYERKTNKLTEYWATPDTDFTSLFNTPLYVLTSKKTFTAGEEFSYDLQTQKRALLIGGVTAGAAHPLATFSATHGFIINIPTARAINTITKTNWEGTGVKPNIEVDEQKALDTALDKIAKI